MHAEIYTKSPCPYCDRAKALFAQHAIAYEEISAVDNREALIDRVTEASGNPPRTVPQIFIDGEYVGGHDALVTWLKDRRV